MKTRHAFLAAACLSLALGAQAQVPQREKMKTCNAEAKTAAMKGEARKAFMKSCLSKGAGDSARAKNTRSKASKS